MINDSFRSRVKYVLFIKKTYINDEVSREINRIILGPPNAVEELLTHILCVKIINEVFAFKE